MECFVDGIGVIGIVDVVERVKVRDFQRIFDDCSERDFALDGWTVGIGRDGGSAHGCQVISTL